MSPKSKSKQSHLLSTGINLNVDKPYLRAAKAKKINLLTPPDQNNLLITSEQKVLTTLAYSPKENETVYVAYLYHKLSSDKPKQFVLLSEDQEVLGVMAPVDLYEALSKFDGIGLKGWKDYHKYSKDDLTRNEILIDAIMPSEEIDNTKIPSETQLKELMTKTLLPNNETFILNPKKFLDSDNVPIVLLENCTPEELKLLEKLSPGNHLQEEFEEKDLVAVSVSPTEAVNYIQEEYSIMQSISNNTDIYLWYVVKENLKTLFVATDASGMILAVADKDYIFRKMPLNLVKDWAEYHIGIVSKKFSDIKTPEELEDFSDSNTLNLEEEYIEFLRLMAKRLKKIKIKANCKKNKKAKKQLKKYSKYIKYFI